MRDCPNGEMRDRLPELMHDRLTGQELLVVRAHVSGCADCRAELVLLEQLRSAAAAPRVDASRIVAALPRYRAVPRLRRMANAPQVRAAAAVLVLLGGYALNQSRSAAGPDRAAPMQTAAIPELAIGDSFQDLSDSDLAAVLDEIGKLEAVTPEAIEEPVLPLTESTPRGGSGT
jgi:hypothetical protein